MSHLFRNSYGTGGMFAWLMGPLDSPDEGEGPHCLAKHGSTCNSPWSGFCTTSLASGLCPTCRAGAVYVDCRREANLGVSYTGNSSQVSYCGGTKRTRQAK